MRIGEEPVGIDVGMFEIFDGRVDGDREERVVILELLLQVVLIATREEFLLKLLVQILKVFADKDLAIL